MSQRPQWNASKVREMLLNPAYAGVGPYPRDAEREGVWVGTVAELMRRDGRVQTLKRVRRLVLDTFGGPDALRADTRWAQQVAARAAESGEEAVLRAWLDELRPALRDVPADAVPELFGFTRSSGTDLSAADRVAPPATTHHVILMDAADEEDAGEWMEDDADADVELPAWLTKVVAAVCGSIECGNPVGGPEYRYAAPDENVYGTHLLEVAPTIFQPVRDGAPVRGPVRDHIRQFHVSAALGVFDGDTGSVSFGREDDGRHAVTLEGDVDGETWVVQVYDRPFADAEPSFEFPLASGDRARPGE